jgi:enediyne biosynthesis protein E5
MALAALGLLTPLLDRALPARRFEWPRGTPVPDGRRPVFTPATISPWGTKETPRP